MFRQVSFTQMGQFKYVADTEETRNIGK